MPGISSFNQGDILLIPFPLSDISGSKQRPVIVISNKLVNGLSDIICAQITSNPRKDSLSFEIKDADVSISLKGYSEVRCHKIFTASKSIVVKKISHVHKTSMINLVKKINTALEVV